MASTQWAAEAGYVRLDVRLDVVPKIGFKEQEFWVDEASDIVKVEVGGVPFRLRQSRLRAHSTSLGRLLSTQSGQEEPQATIIVEGVDALDFQEMLKAMDDAVSYVLDPPPSNIVASVLRAANALACTSLVRFSEKILEEIWSPDLRHISNAPLSHALEIVLLARDLHMPQLLKRAFYELTRGREPLERLSQGDILRVHNAHGELQMAWAGFVWNMPNSHAFQCHGHDSRESERCAAAMDHNRFKTWRDILEEMQLFAPADPLDALRQLAEMSWADRGYCSACVAARRDVFGNKREDLWGKLDQWLQL